ncbi:hypothetical protein ATANTOWER_015576, partial [Ataeniobius toweri]|nr:hypothetical protein [Ataeniobius toweri]
MFTMGQLKLSNLLQATLKKKQWSLAIFSPLEGKFPIMDRYPLDTALDVFEARPKSDDGGTHAPLLRTKEPERTRGKRSIFNLSLFNKSIMKRQCHMLTMQQ